MEECEGKEIQKEMRKKKPVFKKVSKNCLESEKGKYKERA